MEAMRSDVFRVVWVLRKGGYYVDAASEVLSSFDEWVVKDKLILKKPNMIDNKLVWNGFIYAPFQGINFFKKFGHVRNTCCCPEGVILQIYGPKQVLNFSDVLKNLRQEITSEMIILSPGKFDHNFRFGSSAHFLKDRSQHWSTRQDLGESLFVD